jgi:hypothetical protein
MKIGDIPKDKNMVGIKILINGKKVVLRHAWRMEPNGVGIMTMSIKDYAKGSGKVIPVFFDTIEDFFNLEIAD